MPGPEYFEGFARGLEAGWHDGFNESKPGHRFMVTREHREWISSVAGDLATRHTMFRTLEPSAHAPKDVAFARGAAAGIVETLGRLSPLWEVRSPSGRWVTAAMTLSDSLVTCSAEEALQIVGRTDGYRMFPVLQDPWGSGVVE